MVAVYTSSDQGRKSKKHILETYVDRLASEFERRVERTAKDLLGGANQPPWTQKLTEDEQLEMYFAMDGPKWVQMISRYGLKATLEYSKAMMKIVEKRFGLNLTGILVPDGMLNMPEMNVEAQTPSPVDEGPSTDDIIKDALGKVGLDPNNFGFTS